MLSAGSYLTKLVSLSDAELLDYCGRLREQFAGVLELLA